MYDLGQFVTFIINVLEDSFLEIIAILESISNQ